MYSKAKKIAHNNIESTISLKVTFPWVTDEFGET